MVSYLQLSLLQLSALLSHYFNYQRPPLLLLTIPANMKAGIPKMREGGLIMAQMIQAINVYTKKVCGPGKLAFGADTTVGYGADDTLERSTDKRQ